MIRIATYLEIRNLAAKDILSEAAILERAESKLGKNTFLSHSSKDKALLPGIITLLENHGASVYVDNGDSRLPTPPSKVTAEILRDTIQKLPKFVVLVTLNSKDSRWIPWELGLGDAYKTTSHVAILPVVEEADGRGDRWISQEYLGLYSRIALDTESGAFGGRWIVHDALDNKQVGLRDWITRK